MSGLSDNSGSSNDEYDRTILVSGLPEGVKESTVHIHFQKKKNGGGDIEKITLLEGGKAMVVFENAKVAKVVVNTEQIFKEKVLEVKRLGTENLKENVEKLGNEKRKKETRRVLVSDLPEGTTENHVHIHFQKKKNGGGEIEKVELLGKGKAIVVFEESRVAKQVITKEQEIKGNIVHIELMETEPRANVQTSEEAGTSEQESGTVLVSGLPEGVTENGVHIHFQKKKNGGGEIKEVILLSAKKEAIVVFEDMKVAKKVVDREQVFKGKVLNVKLKDTETNPNNEESEKENVEKSRTILVSNLPDGVTESGFHIHFQKKKNGGGEVEKVTVLPEGNTALVVFEDPEVAGRIVTTPQEMEGKSVTVTFLHKKRSPEMKTTHEVKTAAEIKTSLEVTTPEVVGTPNTGKTPEAELQPEERQMEERTTVAGISLVSIDPVFYMVTATVNPVLMNTGTQYFWSDVFNIIQRTCGVHCQVSVYGVMVSGSLSQVTKAGEILELKWRRHCQDFPSTNVDHDNLSNQHGTTFNQHGMTLNQAGMTLNQVGTKVNNGTNSNQMPGMRFHQHNTNFSQCDPKFNQMGLPFNQSRTNFHQHGTTFNQDDAYFTERDTNSNQRDTTSEQSVTNFNESGTHLTERDTARNQRAPTFNQHGKTFYQHAPTSNQHGTTNSTGSPFEQGQFVSSEHAFNSRPESQFYQQNVHQGYQQSGWTDEGHWPNETGLGSANSYTRDLGNTRYNQHPLSEYPDMRSLNQPSDAKQHRFLETTANPQSFGNRPNIPPENISRSPCAGETDTRSAEPPRSSVDTIRNPQPFENPSNRPPPGNIDKSPNSNIMEKDEASGSKASDPLIAKPATSLDSTKTLRPLRHDQNGTSTKSSAGTKNTTLEVDGTSSPGKTKVTATPESSLDGTTSYQPPVNNQQSTTPDPSTGPSSTTSSNLFGSPSDDKEDTRSEKSSLVSPRSTTNHQTPIKNQHSITPNPSMGPKSSTTSSNQFGSPSNHKEDNRSEKPPPVSPRSTTNQQTPVKNQQSLTPNSSMLQKSSNTKTDPGSERSPISTKSATNHQLPVNDQESTSLNTINTITGQENITTSNTPHGLLSNEQPSSHSDKPPGLSETNINPPPKGDDQHNKSPTTEPQNSVNSSNKVLSPGNDQPNANIEKRPPDSTCTTTLQQKTIDQKGTTKNPIIRSPNSATSDDNQTETPSTNTSDSLGEKPSNPTEKTPSNQPQHNQQQPSLEQISSTLEIPNAENCPNNSPVSKPGVTPPNLTEQIPNSKDKSQKRTPIPLPRQNKPGTRQNAAKFAVKPQQPRQGSPSPTIEPNKTCVNDKPTTATEPNKPEQTATTDNSRTSITTDEHNVTTLDEELD
ncbi:poly [ADP-ribose] polymerase 14-like isoform X2 [Paramuricea clavata]|uniref:Poly [ADP-ribose] polymerase 14-like isoform X2 n=1 Tax=Paramuricea clavata TaxID=317549 RepID=A0A7D9J755_PARCT|nr:poly [ADP-ribose] polymerase 14-like isoform X2 [Paramuricea clavata]